MPVDVPAQFEAWAGTAAESATHARQMARRNDFTGASDSKPAVTAEAAGAPEF
jgi:hypothetical protein